MKVPCFPPSSHFLHIFVLVSDHPFFNFLTPSKFYILALTLEVISSEHHFLTLLALNFTMAILAFTCTTRHIKNWASFPPWPSLFVLFGALSSPYHSSIWDTYQPGGSFSGVIPFYLSILFMGFLREEYWSCLPFPAPELFTRTPPSWLALHGMGHSFSELCKSLCHDKAVTHEGDKISYTYIINYAYILSTPSLLKCLIEIRFNLQSNKL